MSDAFPVLLGIDLDAEAIWTGRSAENASRPVLLSHGTFAVREGLDPLLNLFAEHGVKASFFIPGVTVDRRSEEHTAEHQSLMRNSYAVFCLKKKNSQLY